jgi:hypothetical protein
MVTGMIGYWTGVVVGLVFFIGVMWKLFRCVHAWELVDKTTFDPPLHMYVQLGGHRNHAGYLSEAQIQDMSKRTVVLVMRCPKCGAAKIETLKG